MCCTLYPSTMSDTILYAAEARLDGKRVHVMGYQNRASNLGSGPNAMILPIPAATPMTAANGVDMTGDMRHVLAQYKAAYRRHFPEAKTLLYAPARAGAKQVEVFDVGSYTVVLARDATAIPQALEDVRPNRRPKLNPALFDAYARFYPGWHIAVCCYDGDVEAEPMVFWYEPMDPMRLFAPALDGHDGKPPKLDVAADRDHYVFFAAPSGRGGIHVDLSGLRLPPVHDALFSRWFAGTKLRGWMPNGDFWLPVAELAKPEPEMQTLPPPGAA